MQSLHSPSRIVRGLLAVQSPQAPFRQFVIVDVRIFAELTDLKNQLAAGVQSRGISREMLAAMKSPATQQGNAFAARRATARRSPYVILRGTA